MESTSIPTLPISILLVEDEKLSLELIATILTKKFPNIVLYTASNGTTGLELFKTINPAIVITDINMPEMSGELMVDKIRAIKPDTKCIAVTGNNAKTGVQDLFKKGVVFDRFITKPVVFHELFTVIDECLDDIAGMHIDQNIS